MREREQTRGHHSGTHSSQRLSSPADGLSSMAPAVCLFAAERRGGENSGTFSFSPSQHNRRQQPKSQQQQQQPSSSSSSPAPISNIVELLSKSKSGNLMSRRHSQATSTTATPTTDNNESKFIIIIRFHCLACCRHSAESWLMRRRCCCCCCCCRRRIMQRRCSWFGLGLESGGRRHQAAGGELAAAPPPTLLVLVLRLQSVGARLVPALDFGQLSAPVDTCDCSRPRQRCDCDCYARNILQQQHNNAADEINCEHNFPNQRAEQRRVDDHKTDRRAAGTRTQHRRSSEANCATVCDSNSTNKWRNTNNQQSSEQRGGATGCQLLVNCSTTDSTHQPTAGDEQPQQIRLNADGQSELLLAHNLTSVGLAASELARCAEEKQQEQQQQQHASDTSTNHTDDEPNWHELERPPHCNTQACGQFQSAAAKTFLNNTGDQLSQGSGPAEPTREAERTREEEARAEWKWRRSGTKWPAAERQNMQTKCHQDNGNAVAPIQQQQHSAPAFAVQQLSRNYLAPKVYPNNTLLAELNKCHANLTDLWPGASQAARRTFESLAHCWPKRRRRRCQTKQTSESTNTTNLAGKFIIQCDDQSTTSSEPERHSNSSSDERLEVEERTTQQQHQSHQQATRSSNFFQMPESVAKINSNLTGDEYNRALSVLSSDIRFQLHILLYRRIQTIWTLVSTLVCVLAPILLAGQLEATLLAAAGAGWLGLQLLGALLTRQWRRKLDEMLERAVAQANSYFMDHNLMLGVINVGGLVTRTKFLIPMLYFDTSQCREQIESIIGFDSKHKTSQCEPEDKRRYLDYKKIDLPQLEPAAMDEALAQSQLAKKIVLRYSQRWISHFDKRKLMFNEDSLRPRHLSTGKCLCQFIEETFQCGPKHRRRRHHHHHHHQHPNTLALGSSNKITYKKMLKVHQQQRHQLSPSVAIDILDATDTKLTGKKQHLAEFDDSANELTLARKNLMRDTLISSLSQLVSTKERLASMSSGDNLVKVDMGPDSCSGQLQLADHRADSESPYSTAADHHENESTDGELSSSVLQPSDRSDDLIRKLRFILETRSSEYKNGAIFDDYLSAPYRNVQHQQQQQQTSDIYSNNLSHFYLMNNNNNNFKSNQFKSSSNCSTARTTPNVDEINEDYSNQQHFYSDHQQQVDENKVSSYQQQPTQLTITKNATNGMSELFGQNNNLFFVGDKSASQVASQADGDLALKRRALKIC